MRHAHSRPRSHSHPSHRRAFELFGGTSGRLLRHAAENYFEPPLRETWNSLRRRLGEAFHTFSGSASSMASNHSFSHHSTEGSTHEPFSSVSIGPGSTSHVVLGSNKHHHFGHKVNVEAPARTYSTNSAKFASIEGGQSNAVITFPTQGPTGEFRVAAYPTLFDLADFFRRLTDYDPSVPGPVTEGNPVSAGQGGNAAGVLGNTRRYVFKYYRDHYLIGAGQNAGTVILKLYDFTWKGITPQAGSGAADIIGMWDSGLNTLENSASALGDSAVLGTSPMWSPLLRKYYKLHKVTEVLLAPGSFHRHTVVNLINRRVDGQLYQNIMVSTSGQAFPASPADAAVLPVHGAHLTMMSWHGVPAGPTGGAGPVTILPTWLNVVMTRETKILPYIAQTQLPSLVLYKAIPSPATPAIVNEESGLVVNPVAPQ